MPLTPLLEAQADANIRHMKISRTQTARAKARAMFAHREKVLGYLLSAIERQKEFDAVIGYTLAELDKLGVSRSELTELSGLTSTRVSHLINDAPDHIKGLNFDEGQDDEKEDKKDQEEAPRESPDTNIHSEPEHSYGESAI